MHFLDANGQLVASPAAEDRNIFLHICKLLQLPILDIIRVICEYFRPHEQPRGRQQPLVQGANYEDHLDQSHLQERSIGNQV